MTHLTSWQTLHRRTLFTGGPIRELVVEAVRLPDGRTIPDYYTIRLADYVLVYAELPDGTVVLLRQYKHGVGGVCLGFPGGAVEDGESPLDAAKRELVEETGYAADRWIDYGHYVTNANQRCNTAFLFRAEGCRRVSAPTSPDVEQPELLTLREDELLRADVLHQIRLASHIALLAMATHPQLRSGFVR